MKDRRKETGRQGEAFARRYLIEQGFQLLEANWRCRLGEIDIIAREGDILVFIEVRTRSSDRFGTGKESVDWKKQRKLRQVAGVFLSSQTVCALRIRFDMISIRMDAFGQAGHLEHIRNAF